MSWKTENNGFIKTWAQDIRNSYKIRLKYAVVPKGVKTDVRYIDTPYRFESYQEAREYAKELFPCNSFIVDGSSDIPNFNETLVVNKPPLKQVKKDNRKYTNIDITINGANSKLDLEKDVNIKLNDIQVLRRKLDEKEEQLKQAQKAFKK